MIPSDILKQRGIYEEAIKAGWIENNGYWDYPIFSLAGEKIATRGKAYPVYSQTSD